MGLFSPSWQDRDTEKALAAVAALESDGRLFRAAMYAHDETVALAATSRIKDELLLERLALGEPGINLHVAGMALNRIAEYREEFLAILQWLQHEAVVKGDPRARALLCAGMDRADHPAAFAKMLSSLALCDRNDYLKHCDRDVDFLASVLRQLVGIFANFPEDIHSMLWRFSDETILKTLGMLDAMDMALSSVVPTVVGGLRSQESVLTAVSEPDSVAIRNVALERITGEKTFFEIALNNNRRPIRQAAAAKLTCQDNIVRIVAANPSDVTEALLVRALCSDATISKKNGKKHQADEGARPVADNQELLLNIALNSVDSKASKMAASLLTKADDLNVYARHNPGALDEKMVLRLTGQPVLTELACDDRRYAQSVRLAAVSRLTSDERLGQVVWAHTQYSPTNEQKELVSAALKRIRNQDIIYQAMGLADGIKTYIGSDALHYITDKELLLRIALGLNRFNGDAAERIDDEDDLARIVREANRKTEAYAVAVRKLEEKSIASFESADSEVLRAAALSNESSRVRMAALKYIDDQALLDTVARNDDEADVRIAAVGRMTDWKMLFAMIGEQRFDVNHILKRLSSDVFLNVRSEIVTEAVPKSLGEERKASYFVALIAILKDCKEEDVHIEYGGPAYLEKQIAKLQDCKDLETFHDAYRFLRYAYERSEEYRKVLKPIGKKSMSKHVDFYGTSCAGDSCDVMVDVTVDFS